VYEAVDASGGHALGLAESESESESGSESGCVLEHCRCTRQWTRVVGMR
jgi:hypothetical protein